MTLQEMYNKIKADHRGETLIECCDFGDFIGFVFAPKNATEMFGSSYDCIYKATGKRSTFNPPDNFALFEKGKNIPIEKLIK